MVSNLERSGGLKDALLETQKLSPDERNMLKYWKELSTNIDNVFYKQIDETGQSFVVKNYEQDYPSLNATLKGKNNR